jgi:hypothetical protein
MQLVLADFTSIGPRPVRRVKVSDSVVVDAKRILLRYGAPINILDHVSDEDRIALARAIAKTNLPEREGRLRELLAEGGYSGDKESD